MRFLLFNFYAKLGNKFREESIKTTNFSGVDPMGFLLFNFYTKLGNKFQGQFKLLVFMGVGEP